MDLYEQIVQQMHVLDDAIKALAKNGEELANAEKDYKVELTKEVLKQRADGTPVTQISLVVYGMPNVAELRLKRDSAKSKYEACLEFINITKLKLRLLESQLSREYSNTR